MLKKTQKAALFVVAVMTLTWGFPRSSSAQTANDLPKPSADFGTPEGTAKIAAGAGFLDVVGIKLGMSAKDAEQALKAHDAKFKLKPSAFSSPSASSSTSSVSVPPCRKVASTARTVRGLAAE